VTESYATDGSVTGGIPGAVSNLPTPSATGTAATSTGEYVYLRTEETINYEMNQVESHEISGPGEVEKISLSVLVDGVTDTAQLDTIKSAVAAAAGIDETRGDILAVETLAFDRSYYTAQEDELEQTEQTSMYFQYGQYAALALVLILLLWYVGRLFRNLRVSSSEAWTPILKPVSEMAALPGGGMGALGQPMRPLAFPQPSDAQGGEGHLPEVHLPEIPARMQQQAASPEDEQMQRVITRLAEESPANVAEILSVWLNEDEK
jgi:flagellar M-ring protein FliF